MLQALPNPTESPAVNILMVDDSPDKLLAMESVLAGPGQNLVKVTSGEEALRALLKQEFALILLDVNMPGMDGFETASLIRQRKSLEHIPIIFVTALSMTDADVFRGYMFGAVDYILTPIVPEILRTKVGVFVELFRQKHELKEKAEALRILNANLEHRADQLVAINRELESFCYTIAHDLRAPLRAMEGLTSILLEENREVLNAESWDYGDRIRNAACRMDQMIQELLSYSRLTLMEFDPQPVKLSRAMKDVFTQLGWEIEQKKAAVDFKRSKYHVYGHHTMVVQVFSNLVNNALKFVPPGRQPVVKIHDEKRDNRVRVWIEDNGIGIAPEHQQRIFRIFERLHERDQYTGTGIGLAIVEKAVQRMHGNVGLESKVGEGTRFWVELPLCEAELNGGGVSGGTAAVSKANGSSKP